jgi:predicted acyltransferase
MEADPPPTHLQNVNESTPLLVPAINTEADPELQPIIGFRPAPKARVRSLDVFRGITIVGMILVDNQGELMNKDKHIFWPIDESAWNGLRPSDCVFPFFLFIMGMAVAFALKREDPKKLGTWLRVLRRFVILFAVGIFFNLFGTKFTFTHFRIPGVLQRIAICYTLVSIIYLAIPVFLGRLAVILGMTGLYLGIIYGYHVPECGRAILTPACNAAGHIDRVVFGLNYMIKPTDPEGILSTLTATLTTFLGLCFGLIMNKFKDRRPTLPSFLDTEDEKRVKLTAVEESNLDTLKWWVVLATSLVIFPVLLEIKLPIFAFNKKLWSFTFALITAGIAGLVLSLCFFMVDVLDVFLEQKGKKVVDVIIAPFLWLGMNSLLIFLAMILFEILLMSIFHVDLDNEGTQQSLWAYLYENGFHSWIPNAHLASLVFSLAHLLLWLGVAALCYFRKFFLKI